MARLQLRTLFAFLRHQVLLCLDAPLEILMLQKFLQLNFFELVRVSFDGAIHRLNHKLAVRALGEVFCGVLAARVAIVGDFEALDGHHARGRVL